MFQALQKHSLSKLWLLRILEEREKGLNRSVFLTTASMESYAENTFSSLLYLTLEALGMYLLDLSYKPFAFHTLMMTLGSRAGNSLTTDRHVTVLLIDMSNYVVHCF